MGDIRGKIVEVDSTVHAPLSGPPKRRILKQQLQHL